MTLIAAINVAKNSLGMEEQDYRALLERVTGKVSLRQMNGPEHIRVLDELRAKGAPKLLIKGKELPGPYAKKLQALWIAGWNLGVVHDRTDAAMLVFIKRQTGIEHTRFLRDPADARKAVEALKGWIGREGGIDWSSSSRFHGWRNSEPARVAWAQWQKLNPVAHAVADSREFHRTVLQLADVALLDDMKPADWQMVMNALGERIRAPKVKS